VLTPDGGNAGCPLSPQSSHESGRRIATANVAQFCFRNTKIEELHDRISDEEMKTLMIDCANHCYALVCILFSTQGGNDLIEMLKATRPGPAVE
jgi:hypothetical protein